MAGQPGVGDKAPDFNLPADGGQSLALSALKGGKLVLYFYPKDDTPGCTQEAIDFTGLARSMGLAARCVTDPADIVPALREAAGREGPSLVEVMVADGFGG